VAHMHENMGTLKLTLPDSITRAQMRKVVVG